ncbi:unnamed protein product, partial [Arabidopsis halleri]
TTNLHFREDPEPDCSPVMTELTSKLFCHSLTFNVSQPSDTRWRSRGNTFPSHSGVPISLLDPWCDSYIMLSHYHFAG